MFRRKPPGDIAQCVIALMEDPARWRPGLLRVHHRDTELMVRNDWALVVCVGDAGLRLQGRDQRAVDKAYRKLKRRMAEARTAQAAQGVRERLALPAEPGPGSAASIETIEAVEARVRRLREAVMRAALPEATAGPAR